MKKKLILAITIVLLFAIGLSLLVGCDDIFTRNDERDMTQVVARVHYGNETRDIYKYELRSSFASYAYYYINYYGMGAEAAANYILQSLAQQKLLVMYAREQVYFLDNDITQAPAGGIPATVDLLSPAEQNKAVEDANDSLLSSLKSLVEDAITEDNYNNADNTTAAGGSNDDDEDAEITDPVIVRFESYGGTEIERQRIQKDTKAQEPDDPTKDGYTFYGWYVDETYAKSDAFDKDAKEFNFEDPITQSITLHAKWAKYDAPRTALPEEEEEEEEFDPNATIEEADKAKPFFGKEGANDGWDIDKLYDELKDEDFVKNIEHETDEELKTTLDDYIKDALADLTKNLQANLYKKSIYECWEYYLENQYDSLIVDRYERILGDKISVSDEEINAEFDRIVAQNKENFELSDSAYSTLGGTSA